MLNIYNNILEAVQICLNTDEFIDFSPYSKYYGFIINFFNNTTDIIERITKATKVVRALRFIQDSKNVFLDIKISFYQAIPINLTLQNS